MPYATLPLVNPGDVLSSSLWGNVVRSNEDTLYSGRPKYNKAQDSNAFIATTSATFVDVDPTNFVATLTIGSGVVLASFVGVLSGATGANGGYGGNNGVYPMWDISVDGTRLGGTTGIYTSGDSQSNRSGVAFAVQIPGLSVGSHTFKLQWRIISGSGTAYLDAGSGLTNFDFIPRFMVVEIG